VRPGRVACPEHGRTVEGKEAQRALHRMTGDLTKAVAGPAGAGGEATLGKFRQRVARGEYGELLDEAFMEVVWQAGAERSLQDEVGALRVAAKRLLLEEEDPSKMALGLSRVTTTLMRMLEGKGEIERVWRKELSLQQTRERQEAWEAEREAAWRAAHAQKQAEAAAEAEGGGSNDEEGEQREERRTIRQVVDEWWEREGVEQGGPRAEGVVKAGEDEIIDLFSETRPGGWRYELEDDEE
jgi:hypothetical protein